MAFGSSRAIRDKSGKHLPHCQQPLTAWWAPPAAEEGTPPAIPAEIPSSAPQRRGSGCMADLAFTLDIPLSLVSTHTTTIGHCSSWDSSNASRLQPKHVPWEFAGSLEQRLLGQEHPIYLFSANSDVPCQPCTCQKSFATSLVIWESRTWGIPSFHTTRCDIFSWYHSGQRLGGTKLPCVKKKLHESIPLLYWCQLKPRVK